MENSAPQRRLHRNLVLLQLLSAGLFFLVYISLAQLYWTQNGLSQAQIATIQVTPFLVILSLDILTSHLADRWSFRGCIILGALLETGGYILWRLEPGHYSLLLLGAVVFGAGDAFIRGANHALGNATASRLTGYHGAAKDHQTRPYERFQRQMVGVMGASEGTAALLALEITRHQIRWLGHTAPQAALSIQIIVTSLLIVLGAGLTEVRPEKDRNPVSLVKNVMSMVFGEQDIRIVIVFAAIIGASTQAMVYLGPVKMEQLHLSAEEFTIWWMAAHYMLAISNPALRWWIKHFRRWKHRRINQAPLPVPPPWRPFAGLMVAVGLGYLGAALLPGRWALLAIPLLRIIWGIQQPIVSVYLARLVPPNRNATVLAVKSTVQFLVFAGTYFALAEIVDFASLTWAFIIAAGLYAIPGFLAGRKAKHVRRYHEY